jgi:hypothetical protein
MRTATAVLRAENEAPRATRQGRRGIECLFDRNTSNSIISDLRLQRLSRAGVTGPRAELLADLAWGVAA